MTDDSFSQCRKPGGNRQCELGRLPNPHGAIVWGAHCPTAIGAETGRRKNFGAAAEWIGYRLACAGVPDAHSSVLGRRDERFSVSAEIDGPDDITMSDRHCQRFVGMAVPDARCISSRSR